MMNEKHLLALMDIAEHGKGRPNNRVMYALDKDFVTMRPLRDAGLIHTSWGSCYLSEVTDEMYANVTEKGQIVCRLYVDALGMMNVEDLLSGASLLLASKARRRAGE